MIDLLSPLSLLTWAGNLLIVVGLYKIGNKQRSAFIWSICGESAWTAAAIVREDWALATICTIFNIMAMRNFAKWGETR